MSDVVWLYGEIFLLVFAAFLGGALVTAGVLRVVLPLRERVLDDSAAPVDAGDPS